MAEDKKQQLEQQLWKIADTLRGKMSADDFRDYILGFIFYKYLSEKMHAYANAILKPDKLKYEEVESHKDSKTYLTAIKDEALNKLGYFLKPSELFNVGIGLMPSLFINQSSLEQIYIRKYDLSGVIKAEIFPIKMLGIEATYNTGFLPQELIFTDQNGATSLIKSKNKLISLGLKLRF